MDDGSAGRDVRASRPVAGTRRAGARASRFTRNFGQTAAFAAGFAVPAAQFIVTFDGDLQNDPADIPRLVDARRHRTTSSAAGAATARTRS